MARLLHFTDMHLRCTLPGTAILSGHYHPGSLVEKDGIIYSVPPAFCEAPYAFRVYDIDDDGAAIVTDHALDA